MPVIKNFVVRTVRYQSERDGEATRGLKHGQEIVFSRCKWIAPWCRGFPKGRSLVFANQTNQADHQKRYEPYEEQGEAD